MTVCSVQEVVLFHLQHRADAGGQLEVLASGEAFSLLSVLECFHHVYLQPNAVAQNSDLFLHFLSAYKKRRSFLQD